MKAHLIFLVPICVAVLTGCQDNSTQGINNIVIDKTISIDQLQKLSSVSYRDSFWIESVNDTRCPLGAYCLMPGNAKVNFIFSHNEVLSKFTLSTQVLSKDTILFGYNIELLELAPLTTISIPIEQSDYLAHVKVKKVQ